MSSLTKKPLTLIALQNTFEVFCNLLVSRIHFRYHEQLERLKNSYALFDPNKDVRTPQDIIDSQRKAVIIAYSCR
ncbi:hypothetical protein [Alteromonas sp. P256]|uniref:hypothetical protein n=1 Tax=Alteromonas sp. P256 TaxID=3117399 RepID=UPI002FE1FB04